MLVLDFFQGSGLLKLGVGQELDVGVDGPAELAYGPVAGEAVKSGGDGVDAPGLRVLGLLRGKPLQGGHQCVRLGIELGEGRNGK